MWIFLYLNQLVLAHHLTEYGFLLQALLPGLQYINRPYKLNGDELQGFLTNLREASKENRLNFNDHNSLSHDVF